MIEEDRAKKAEMILSDLIPEPHADVMTKKDFGAIGQPVPSHLGQLKLPSQENNFYSTLDQDQPESPFRPWVKSNSPDLFDFFG